MASTASRRNLSRISEIAQVAVRHGFGYFFETHRLTDLLPGHPKLDPAVTSPSERGRPRLRLLLRAPPPPRPAAGPPEARPRRHEPLRARPAPPRDARRARPD